MTGFTPARLYALIFGAVLLIAGVIGFFYSGDFDTGDAVPRDAVLGILDVNGWHNIVHLASGAVGLLAALSAASARAYALVFGVVYIGVAVWGFIEGDGGVILDFLPVNTEDNVLHALIGVVGVGAGLAPAPGRETAASPGQA
jgi:hypothetical protein